MTHDVNRLSRLLHTMRNGKQKEAAELRIRAEDLDAEAKTIEAARRAILKADDDASRLRYPDTTGR